MFKWQQREKRTFGKAEEALKGPTGGGVAKDRPAAGAELVLWSVTTDSGQPRWQDFSCGNIVVEESGHKTHVTARNFGCVLQGRPLFPMHVTMVTVLIHSEQGVIDALDFVDNCLPAMPHTYQGSVRYKQENTGRPC